MSAYHELHSIFVVHNGAPVEIYISRKYQTKLENNRILIRAVDRHDELLRDARVASFTCLFGENGSGKTKLLMDLATTFSEGSKTKQIGVLFSVDGELYLHRGKALANMSLDTAGLYAEPRIPRDVPIVFYTTSPFDNERRRILKRLNVADMTPQYGADRKFDGLSLVLHCDEIGGPGAAITENLKITVRGRVSRERTVERLLTELLDRFAFDENNSLARAKSMFVNWMRPLPSERKQALMVDLIIISDAERNQNVAGKFVGDLMRLADRFIDEPAPPRPGHIVDLARAAIIQSNFIRFTSEEVLYGLQAIQRNLTPNKNAVNFTIQAVPSDIRGALDAVEEVQPGLVRFLADFGFIDFKLSKLSSGETAFLYLFSALGAAMDKIARRGSDGPMWLMLDEGEMFMHPAWQREYVQNILDFIGQLKPTGLDVHVMLTTHSLIVAADAPPRSLFNVQHGQRMNGFGLGPAATLHALYGVNEFAGEHASPMVGELTTFLRDPRQPVTERILQLRNALADLDLKRYVEQTILNRRQA